MRRSFLKRFERIPATALFALCAFALAQISGPEVGIGGSSTSELKVNQGKFLSEGEVMMNAAWPAAELSEERSGSIEVEGLP